MHLLPPTTKLRQGNVFTPVCHSVHRGVSATPLGRHIPGQTPPGRHPMGRHPPGRHPQADTPRQTSPLADTPRQTPPGQTPQADTPWADTPLARHPPPHPVHAGIYTLLPSTCWDTVNKRAVRIPLECILVNFQIGHQSD